MSGSPRRDRPGHALVVGDGAVPSRGALDVAWPGWADGIAFVVAADGGALRAERLRLPPDLVVGDFDSLDPPGVERMRAAGVSIEAWPAAKEASDLELAIRAALVRRPRHITVLGALGGARLDHALANLWLLALAELASTPTSCLDERTRVRLLSGPGALTLQGPAGDLVSLFPLGGEALGVTTAGLAYPLRDESLVVGPSRGLSNVRSGTRSRVSLRAGQLLIVESHSQEGVLP